MSDRTEAPDQAPTAEEFDAVLESLALMTKSTLGDNVQFTGAPSFAPEAAFAPEPESDPEPEYMHKSALPADVETVDAYPVIAALMDGHNNLVAGQHAIGGEAREARKELRIVAKALVAIGGQIKQLAEAPRGGGRRAILNPSEVPAGRQAAGAAPGAIEGVDALAGADLVAKAVVAKDQGALSAHHVAQLESWVNHAPGVNLAGIAAQDPALGADCRRALSA